MFKVIIAGGRDFQDYKLLKKYCEKVLVNKNFVEIVSGHAKGADTLGEKFAKEIGYDLIKFPAEWKKFGKSAGYKRNKKMAIYADALIAFWDGRSKGTKLMLELAKEYKLKIRVCNY